MSTNTDFEYSTDLASGKPVITVKNQPLPGERTQTLGGILSPVGQNIRKIEQAVKSLEKLGFDVPAILRNATDNIGAIRMIAVEPAMPNPADPADKFEKALTKYATDLREYNARKDAQTKVLEAAYSHALSVRRVASDEVSPALAARFDEVAKVYADHFAVLRDVANLGEAAAMDRSGGLVVRWHDMSRAADDLNALVDCWKSLTPSLDGENWTTEDLLAVCAPVGRQDATVLGNSIRSGAKTPDKRYRVLLEAGYRLKFAKSRSELLSRRALTEDDDDEE